MPPLLVTSSTPQPTHQVTQGQARLCSGVEATLSHSPLHSFQTACLFLTCLLLRCCCSSPLSLSGCEVSGFPLPAQRPVPSAGGRGQPPSTPWGGHWAGPGWLSETKCFVQSERPTDSVTGRAVSRTGSAEGVGSRC